MRHTPNSLFFCIQITLITSVFRRFAPFSWHGIYPGKHKHPFQTSAKNSFTENPPKPKRQWKPPWPFCQSEGPRAFGSAKLWWLGRKSQDQVSKHAAVDLSFFEHRNSCNYHSQKKIGGWRKNTNFFVVGNFKVIGFCWLHNKKTCHLLSSGSKSSNFRVFFCGSFTSSNFPKPKLLERNEPTNQPTSPALSTRSWLMVDVSGLLS